MVPFPSSYANTINLGGQTIPTASSAFHVYTLDWSEEEMVFSVDGVEHYTYNPIIKDSDTWPFDTEQYILLNIAIESGIDPAFTQSTMEIDYVRVYQETSLSVSDVDDNEVAIFFPNPVEDKFTIQLPTNLFGTNVKATIYSVLGQELKSFVQTEPQMVVDISHYEKGIYLVRLEAKNKITSYKIIKK